MTGYWGRFRVDAISSTLRAGHQHRLCFSQTSRNIIGLGWQRRILVFYVPVGLIFLRNVKFSFHHLRGVVV